METEDRIRRYAWKMIIEGAESTIEDDMNEDGELSEEEHQAAYDLAMAVVKGLRETKLV